MRFIATPEFLGEDQSYTFPPAASATSDGVVCYGGNLSPGVLLSAYRQGIFPWPSNPKLLRWCSPNPRFVIPRGFLHIAESAEKALRRALRQGELYSITLDKAFPDIIAHCAQSPREGQPGTWIFPALVEGYIQLHRLGYAHSVEVWKEGTLIGGLYGVSLGAAFFGESMFSLESNASKIGFLSLAIALFARGFEFIDCQVYTPYLELMGGLDIPRQMYLVMLNSALDSPTLRGSWNRVFHDFPNRELIFSTARRAEHFARQDR